MAFRSISIVALALAAVLGSGHARAQSNGRIYMLDRTNGNELIAGLDFPGLFSTSFFAGTPALTGATRVVPTRNGLFVYNGATGFGDVVRIGANGVPNHAAPSGGFTTGWDQIVSLGDYLFFYRLDGLSAIGYITQSGTFVQTQTFYLSTGWTHVRATDNYLFFYNLNTGITATASIDPLGHFVQTSASPTRTRYSYIVSIGDQLLLYNQATGAYETGQIRLVSGNSGLAGTYELSSSGIFAAGFNKLAAQNNNLLLYNVSTGAGLIGHLDRSGGWVGTQTLHWPSGRTVLIGTFHYFFTYSGFDGNGSVGYINTSGQYVNTQNFAAGLFSYVAATRW